MRVDNQYNIITRVFVLVYDTQLFLFYEVTRQVDKKRE